MGEACCVAEPNAECEIRNAECQRERRLASDLSLQFRTPHSAFRTPLRMKFPDRLPIPAEVFRIARTLEDAGFETWCVGGAIRDNLLGLENHDFDLTTAAPPEEVRRLFKRTVPVGIETAPWRCSIATTGPTRSPRSAGTSAPTAGTPWWSSACRSPTTSRGATSRSTRSPTIRSGTNGATPSRAPTTWPRS